MEISFFKYHGAGNDFVVIDNRSDVFPKTAVKKIQNLCDRRFGIGSDGLILLEKSDTADFKMVYFNADGKAGSMCGNGGRCIVAFARNLGIIDKHTTFDAVDGLHYAEIEHDQINLKMTDIETGSIGVFQNHTFLDTGSPHHVMFHENIKNLDVKRLGREIRYGSPYGEAGTNVNFVEQINSAYFKVRTYERGVENETLACGTGVTAVAIAANQTGRTKSQRVVIDVQGGILEVSFVKGKTGYTDVYLKGPAVCVFNGKIDI